jgi:2-polyprenyl-3-methyl-5-hydroxy-6-metoxy-1,4-benzoquinol methylase
MNWYNLPTYYDISFSEGMREELDFLKAVFSKYSKGEYARLLEPACGTGRLIIPLARCGFDCTGFDLNDNALKYLQEKLKRNSLRATIFKGDMIDFPANRKKYDAAYCTVDTFRHLLSESKAIQHMLNVAGVLKKNGIYILGLHLIPEQGVTDKITRWTAKRGRLTVKTSIEMLALNKKEQTETLRVVLNPITITGNEKFESIYKLRTYSLKQFQKLVASSKHFEIENVYDHNYDIANPVMLNAKSDYGVFVLRKSS